MKTNLTKLLGILLVCMMSVPAFAQGGYRVKGTVVDDQGPVSGATAVERGTANGVSTGAAGDFVLSVSGPDAMIDISCIGYTTVSYKASELPAIVSLDEDSEFLDEVVVIGYGEVRKADATGSVLAIRPDELNKGNQVTAQDALVGKIAGLQVVPGSGAPGSGATIRIRMGASINASNDPLIVIDGVPISNETPEGASNLLSMINPADIESFTVLKDASATAIFGSRASNGVIMVTTKKGTGLGRVAPTVNYSGNMSVSTRYSTLEVLDGDEYRTVFKEHSSNPDFAVGTDNTNWQDQLYRTAISHDHSISVSGATARMPYRVSLGYTDQNGVIRGNNYKRFTVGAGIAPRLLDDHLLIDLNLKASHEDNHKIDGGAIESAVSFDPTRPVHASYPDNIGLGYWMWMMDGAPINIADDNPVALAELITRRSLVKRSIGNAKVTYKVHGLEDLSATVNAGYDVLGSNYNKVIPEFSQMAYTGNRKDGTGQDYNADVKKYNTLLDAYLNYNHTFADAHLLDLTSGYSWQHFYTGREATTLDTHGNEISSPESDASEHFLVSFFGRANYSYKHRYLLTATIRTDASSRFSPENRWGLFPSVAAAWNVAEESFLKDNPVVSDLKLRLSWGKTGQQDIGTDYAYQPSYTSSSAEAMYKFGDKWITTYRPNGYDPNLRWETTTTWNAGVDFGFLDGRLGGSVDVYKRNTEDLLMEDVPQPAGANFAPTVTTNVGSMTNKGIEIALNAIPVSRRDLQWVVSANLTHNLATITKLSAVESEDSYVKTGNAGGTGKYLQIHKVGSTPYTWFLLKQAYDDNGKPLEGQYIGEDGSIVNTEDDVNKYNTGKSSLPPFYAGLSTRVNYKNWDFGVNGHGSFGQYVFNNVAAKESFDQLYNDGACSNILKATLEHGFNEQCRYSDYFLENGSFFRIDNITLGYTFNDLLNGAVRTARVALTAQNPWIFTHYTGLDPEVYSGIDREVYQRPRVFLVSLNLNF